MIPPLIKLSALLLTMKLIEYLLIGDGSVGYNPRFLTIMGHRKGPEQNISAEKISYLSTVDLGGNLGYAGKMKLPSFEEGGKPDPESKLFRVISAANEKGCEINVKAFGQNKMYINDYHPNTGRSLPDDTADRLIEYIDKI